MGVMQNKQEIMQKLVKLNFVLEKEKKEGLEQSVKWQERKYKKKNQNSRNRGEKELWKGKYDQERERRK